MTGNADRFLELLERYQKGDKVALGELLDVIYEELKGIARRQLKGSPAATLTPTALVNEAYLHLAGKSAFAVGDRRHFVNLAAQVMRWVFLDYAKSKRQQKRGGGKIRVTLNEELVGKGGTGGTLDVVELCDALEKLEQYDKRLSRVVALRCIVGLSIDETAEVLETSSATVRRDWTLAKVWLARELGSEKKPAA